MDNVLETLAHGCVSCGRAFAPQHRVTSVYKRGEVTSFEDQVELGIIGGGVRNHWLHLYCQDPLLKEHELKPDINHCMECREGLNKEDMIIPVFRVEEPRAINPLDPQDVGLSLGERVYFVHSNCRNRILTAHSNNPLYRG